MLCIDCREGGFAAWVPPDENPWLRFSCEQANCIVNLAAAKEGMLPAANPVFRPKDKVADWEKR